MNARLPMLSVRFAVYSLLSSNVGDYFTTSDIMQVLKLHCAQGEIRRALGFYMRKHKVVRHGAWDKYGSRTRRYAVLSDRERRANQAKKRKSRKI